MDFLTAGEYDPSSIALSIGFATIGSFLTIDFMSRMNKGDIASRLGWLFIVSVICGASTWATQVMSVEAGGSTSFAPRVLFSALLAMIAFTTVGVALAMRKSTPVNVELGGALVGVGNVVGFNIVISSAGGVISASLDRISTSQLITVCLSAISFSVAVRTSRRGLASLVLVAALGILIYGSDIEIASLVASSSGASREIVVLSAVVVMVAVLCTAFATYNVEYQSRLEAVEALRNYSVIDSLTGLSNRDALKAHIAKLIETTDRSTEKFSVFAFNLNRFRLVNDVHGSEAGDIILKTVARRIEATLGPGEFLARVSGDEFYAVKSGIHLKADAVAFATKLLEIVQEPIQWKASKLDVTARIGGALFPNTSESVEELISQADIAMCRAQVTNIGEVTFFDPSVDKAKRDLNALSIDMRKAIDEGEFEIYYQPQHSVTTRDLIGFEALIRWNHPVRGMVSPADFIPLAEKTGMINEIGAWVIREACSKASQWDSPITVAVNVSASQIMRNDLPDIVSDAIQRSGIDPCRLELEITETGIINDERHALTILGRLKLLGCSIAMDDFGTGFSSLSTFKTFPFDKIKIDRSFISDLEHNKQSYAIVNATVGVGRPLNIKVLAEGVESEEQLAILTELGCDDVQGFYFGHPAPAHEADALMRAARQTPRFPKNVVEFKAGGR